MYPWDRVNCADIVVGNKIGSGAFASVHEAVCFGRARVATKKVSLQYIRFVNLCFFITELNSSLHCISDLYMHMHT